MFDKYVDAEYQLRAGATHWNFSVGGRDQTFYFENGPVGLLQQKLVMLTQSDSAPATIFKFTRSMLLHWPLYLKLLEDGPSRVQEHWDDSVHDIDTAKAAKSILRLAALATLGEWNELHENLILGLDTRANQSVARQRSRVGQRNKLLSVDVQTQLVSVLDGCSTTSNLDEAHCEGLVALALHFQHAMRPVQILSIQRVHVHLLDDISGKQTCVISFHAAKKKKKVVDNEEMLRSVNPEWVPFIASLLAHAKRAGRTRLFTPQSSDQLWSKVRDVCRESGFLVKFTANVLRHTTVQSLADAGHSRRSIRLFLGQTNDNAATTYIKASRSHGNLINKALGISKLYNKICSLAAGEYVTAQELRSCSEDEQIGGIIGDRLIGGIGKCRAGQSHCPFDPVVSCYGCGKYIPALDSSAHKEAIMGMRYQALEFIKKGVGEGSPAYLQLTKALAGAQRALDDSTRMLANAKKQNS